MQKTWDECLQTNFCRGIFITNYSHSSRFFGLHFIVKPKLGLTKFLLSLPHPHPSFLSQMKGMAKIRLFYSGVMALILPQLKDIANFVLKLCTSFNIFVSLSDPHTMAAIMVGVYVTSVSYICTLDTKIMAAIVWLSFVFGVIRKRPIHLKYMGLVSGVILTFDPTSK